MLRSYEKMDGYNNEHDICERNQQPWFPLEVGNNFNQCNATTTEKNSTIHHIKIKRPKKSQTLQISFYSNPKKYSQKITIHQKNNPLRTVYILTPTNHQHFVKLAYLYPLNVRFLHIQSISEKTGI